MRRTHSRNIVVRPEISIVVFDSAMLIGTGQGVYMSAVAGEVLAAQLVRGIDIFPRRSLSHGGEEWTVQDVQRNDGLHLFRATASAHSMLARDDRPDHRIVVNLSE